MILSSIYKFNNPLLRNITIYNIKSNNILLLDTIYIDLRVLYIKYKGQVLLHIYYINSI
jgi:hypothetical protein